MTKKIKSILHDATPSWNGYNYQGKIGLYVCLTNILKEAQKGIDLPSFEVFLNEHHIEYEWIEDFAIKRNETYLSLHQVKHKDKNNFNDHIEAIKTILLRKKGVLSKTDIFKYFEFKGDKKEKVADKKLKLETEIDKNGLINKDGKIDENWKNKMNYVDKKYRNKLIKCFTDFELLLQKAFGSSITYFHTAEEVKRPNKDISEITALSTHLTQALEEPKSLSCKQIFLSFDNPTDYDLALSDEELNLKLDEHVLKILELFHSLSPVDIDQSKIRLYRVALCSLIDQHLIKRHKNIRDKLDSEKQYLEKKKSSISFREMLEEMKMNYEVHNIHYWNLVCRQGFELAYEESLRDSLYLLENSIIDILTYKKYIVRLEFIRTNIINKFFPKKCIDLLKILYPHEILGNQEHLYYSAISEPQKIKSVFLNFIKKVNVRTGKLTLISKNLRAKYLPSCIDFNESDPEMEFVEFNRVKKGLIENKSSLSNEFNDVDYLVINSTDCKYKKPTGIEKITEVESYSTALRSIDEHHNIVNPKEVSFIDSRRALGEING